MKNQPPAGTKARKNTIYAAEAAKEIVPREPAYEGPTLTFTEKQPPVHIVKGTFRATVPYSIVGWKSSLDLRKEKEEELLRELRGWNKKLLAIYATADAAAHKTAFGRRLAEFDTVYYFGVGEDAGNADTAPIFPARFKSAVAAPDAQYSLGIYADGKLAGVHLPYCQPGFIHEPAIKEANSKTITLLALFHRRARGLPLEIIR